MGPDQTVLKGPLHAVTTSRQSELVRIVLLIHSPVRIDPYSAPEPSLHQHMLSNTSIRRVIPNVPGRSIYRRCLRTRIGLHGDGGPVVIPCFPDVR